MGGYDLEWWEGKDMQGSSLGLLKIPPNMHVTRQYLQKNTIKVSRLRNMEYY
jgi:hypothetical protein